MREVSRLLRLPFGIPNLPIYMVMFLKDEPIEFFDISIDKFKI